MPDLRTRRRAEILDAARVIVAGEGLDKLTFSRLERELSFTRGVISYHFANKDDIVRALLDDAVERIGSAANEAVVRAPDPHAAVEAAIGAMVDGFLAHLDATHVLLSFWGRLESDPGARETNARLYRTYREQAAGLIRHGQQAGRFRHDADVHAASAVMVGAVIGIVGQLLFEQDCIVREASVRVAGRSLGDWLCAEPAIP